jgi:hypothetical protein
MRPIRRSAPWLLAFLATILAACSTAVVNSSPASNNGPSIDPSYGPDASAKPYVQSFVPPYASSHPGPGTKIDAAMLSPDRRELTITFTGDRSDTRSDWCGRDYGAWAGLDGDALVVAITSIPHLDQATPPPNSGCTLIGYGYRFTIALPAPFEGSNVHDIGSGPLWVPDPARLAVAGLLPAGWERWNFGGSAFADPGPHAFWQMYGSTEPGHGDAFMSLSQTFGAPDHHGDSFVPMSTVTVHGQRVTLFGIPGTRTHLVSWTVNGDGLTLTAYDAKMTTDQFVAIANAVDVPPGFASPSP